MTSAKRSIMINEPALKADPLRPSPWDSMLVPSLG